MGVRSCSLFLYKFFVCTNTIICSLLKNNRIVLAENDIEIPFCKFSVYAKFEYLTFDPFAVKGCGVKL